MSNVNKRIRRFKVHHESPFDDVYRTHLRFILLPYGNSYGDVPRNAGHGDRIVFLNGDEAEIISVAVCEVRNKLLSLLTYMRYGADFNAVFEAWVKRCLSIGARRNAISDRECLFVWHGEIID